MIHSSLLRSLALLPSLFFLSEAMAIPPNIPPDLTLRLAGSTIQDNNLVKVLENPLPFWHAGSIQGRGPQGQGHLLEGVFLSDRFQQGAGSDFAQPQVAGSETQPQRDHHRGLPADGTEQGDRFHGCRQ